jgi:excisionase family DNA binding protein
MESDLGFCTIGPAARYLGLHPETLRRLDRRGVLKARRFPGSTRRVYTKKQLDEFLAAIFESPTDDRQ